MHKIALIMALTLQVLAVGPAASQMSGEVICDTIFKRPAYPTRQAFCVLGELVEDAYEPGAFYPCEKMEVDHLVSLRYAHRNGICDPNELRRLANHPSNLRITFWRTNRSKATLSPEEFAIKRLSPEVAEMVIRDAAELRTAFGLPALKIMPEIRSRWLLEERDDLRRKNAQLIEIADKIREKQVLYRGRSMRAAHAVSNHVSRVTRRITVSSFRNVGSMAAEALPFVGVAAIAGVTALELHDACEALKDVQELNIAFNPRSGPLEESQTVCSLEIPSREDLLSTIQKSPGQAWETAREYTSTLPPLSDVEIDWSESFGTIKSGADWIIAETSATTASFLKVVAETFGQIELPKLPWQ